MANQAEGFSKRIQANVPAELKDQVRALVEQGAYDSEAEAVRAALWQFVGQGRTASPAPASPQEPLSDDLHNDLKRRLDLLAWLMTVALLLMATIASRILNALGRGSVEPMQLIDEALRASVQDQQTARRKLAAGWRAFREAGQRRL